MLMNRQQNGLLSNMALPDGYIDSEVQRMPCSHRQYRTPAGINHPVRRGQVAIFAAGLAGISAWAPSAAGRRVRDKPSLMPAALGAAVAFAGASRFTGLAGAGIRRRPHLPRRLARTLRPAPGRGHTPAEPEPPPARHPARPGGHGRQDLDSVRGGRLRQLRPDVAALYKLFVDSDTLPQVHYGCLYQEDNYEIPRG